MCSPAATGGRDAYSYRNILAKKRIPSDASGVLHSPSQSASDTPKAVLVSPKSPVTDPSRVTALHQSKSVASTSRGRIKVVPTNPTTTSKPPSSRRRIRISKQQSTKKTSFSDLLKEAAQEKTRKNKRKYKKHTSPTYRVQPLTQSTVQIRPASAGIFSSISTIVLATPVYSMSTIAQLSRTSSRKSPTYSTRSITPSQTISLPPLTVKLFADSMPDPKDMTYGHPDYNELHKKNHSSYSGSNTLDSSTMSAMEASASESAPLPIIARLPNDEVYMLPAASQQRSTRRSTTEAPAKIRLARHNAQNPYSYRELFSEEESPDYQPTGSSGRGATRRQLDREPSNIEPTHERDPRRRPVEPDYEQNYDESPDSSNYQIHAAGELKFVSGVHTYMFL